MWIRRCTCENIFRELKYFWSFQTKLDSFFKKIRPGARPVLCVWLFVFLLIIYSSYKLFFFFFFFKVWPELRGLLYFFASILFHKFHRFTCFFSSHKPFTHDTIAQYLKTEERAYARSLHFYHLTNKITPIYEQDPTGYKPQYATNL